jgi:sarcosine oxidase
VAYQELAPVPERSRSSPRLLSLASRPWDVVVVGAGSFGSWIAWSLRQRGRRVLLVDQYGPGNTRSSSGGESRIIRMGYGPDELYTRFSLASLEAWKRLFEAAGEPLFAQTGVLWLAGAQDRYAADTLATLERTNVPHERLTADDLRKRYPQITLDADVWGMLEPDSGVLFARRAVAAVVKDAVGAGAEYRQAFAAAPRGGGRLEGLPGLLDSRAETFVFACGPWLPKVFPDLLGERIFPTRQEVFFFGTPSGDDRFSAPRMPTWIDFGGDEVYGMPDLEGRGFKVAPDRHGEPFDPDVGERLVSAESTARVRSFLARRFPALASAPLLETRVCQYENTWNGDFLIDRHPDFENVWIAGGGSGHGFKHGPAVGSYVADLVTGEGVAEPRFALAAKQTVQKRAVY